MDELISPHHSPERKNELPSECDFTRNSVADTMLDSLDRIIQRHRSIAVPDRYSRLHAELVASEVEHELAVAPHESGWRRG